MRLPNGDRAELGSKLEDYVLNPAHPDGRHKARVFKAALGITHYNYEALVEALLEAAANSDEVEVVGDNGFGIEYIVRLPVTTHRGSRVVKARWIVRYGEDIPRLTTCYII